MKTKFVIEVQNLIIPWVLENVLFLLNRFY